MEYQNPDAMVRRISDGFFSTSFIFNGSCNKEIKPVIMEECELECRCESTLKFFRNFQSVWILSEKTAEAITTNDDLF